MSLRTRHLSAPTHIREGLPLPMEPGRAGERRQDAGAKRHRASEARMAEASVRRNWEGQPRPLTIDFFPKG
jgi:hypothetical protein